MLKVVKKFNDVSAYIAQMDQSAGMTIGDLHFELLFTERRQSARWRQLYKQEDNCVEMCDRRQFQNVTITPADLMGDGREAWLYQALYNVCCVYSEEFNAEAFKGAFRKLDKIDLKNCVHAVPMLPTPKCNQLVVDIDKARACLYTEYASGYPPHNGFPAHWRIYQSPMLTFPSDQIPKEWARVFKAVQSIPSSNAEPFHVRLANDPTIKLEF